MLQAAVVPVREETIAAILNTEDLHAALIEDSLELHQTCLMEINAASLDAMDAIVLRIQVQLGQARTRPV